MYTHTEVEDTSTSVEALLYLEMHHQDVKWVALQLERLDALESKKENKSNLIHLLKNYEHQKNPLADKG